MYVSFVFFSSGTRLHSFSVVLFFFFFGFGRGIIVRMTLGLRAPFVILFPLLQIDDTCTPPWETCTEECFHPTHPTAVSLLDDRFSRTLAVPGYFLPPSTIYFAPYCARHLGFFFFFLLLRWPHTLCLPCRAAHPSPSERAHRLAVVCFACSLFLMRNFLNLVCFLLPIPLLTHT